MRARSYQLALMAALVLLSPEVARAQKMDKEDKTFLDDVHPILLPDEEKLYKSLKDKSDRLEFQKIFWARRDPDLATPANEYQARYEEARAEADRLYKRPALAGSLTDCGRVYILLGKPASVQQDSGSLAPGQHGPETWTYEGQRFTGGKATIAFDDECRAPAGLGEQLDHVAASYVVQSSLEYKRDKDGHLTKLADLLPKDSPTRALLKQPRQDFASALQADYLKVADGGTALLGLLRGDASGLATSDGPAGKTVAVSVAASAVSEDGKEAGWTELATTAPVGPDGGFLAGFKLALRPGRYTLKAGAIDAKDGKGSLATLPIEVPDLSKVETAADGTTSKVPSAGSLIVVKRIDELAGGASDPKHPLAAFELGPVRLVPAFGGSAKQSEQVEFFYQVYDLKLDAATGKANASAVVSIYKDGSKTLVTSSPAIPIETEVAGSTVGPIPLTSFSPGKYTVELKVTDKLAKRELVQQTALEVTP